LHSFRGIRKTTTATRVVAQWKLAWWRIPSIELVYVTSSDDLKKVFPDGGFGARLAQRIAQTLLELPISIIAAMLLAWLWRGSWATVVAAGWAVFPGPEAALVFAFTCLMVALRRKVIIVDDMLGFNLGSSHGTTVSKTTLVQWKLNQLKHLASKGAGVIVISSNEGISRLLEDTNPTTFRETKFQNDARTMEVESIEASCI
jgi:hypothetical protein